MYLDVKVRLSNKFWARHLVDHVAIWLKCNSTLLFRVDSRPPEAFCPDSGLVMTSRLVFTNVDERGRFTCAINLSDWDEKTGLRGMH